MPMEKEKVLRDRVAIVTGGGRGIGRAISLAFAEEGAKVLIYDLAGSLAREVAEEINKRGGEATDMEGSVGDESQVEEMVRETLGRYGDVNILVTSAGVVGSKGLFEKIRLEDWQKVLHINLTGTFLCCRAVLPHMKKSRSGKIIMIGSTAGLRMGVLGGPHYAASKSGLNSLLRHLAFEVGPYGINVNMVVPGPSDTPMRDERAAGASEVRRRQVPLGRFITPEEIADAVVFLSSDKARMITGAFLPVDGGVLTGWCEPEVYYTSLLGLDFVNTKAGKG